MPLWPRRATRPPAETRGPLDEQLAAFAGLVDADGLGEAERETAGMQRLSLGGPDRATYPMADASSEYSLKQAGRDVSNRARKLTLYQAYLGESWVSACCEAIAARLISGGWSLRPADPKRPNARTRGPLAELLNWCNQDEDFNQILHDAATDLLWAGECYLEVTWKRSPALRREVPYELYTVDAISMDYVLDPSKKGIAGYAQTVDDGQPVRLEPRQIIRVWFPDPRNRLRALSPIEKLINPVTMDTFLQLSEQKYFEQGNRGDVHINLGAGSEETAGRLQKWIAERFLGVKNAHKPLVTYGENTQVTTIGNRAQMDIIGRRKLIRDEVLAVYKVPPHMVSSMEGTGQGGQAVGDTMEKQFIHTAVDPLRQRLMGPLTFRLAVQGFGVDDWAIDTSYADFRDTRDIARIQAERIRYGVSSINEERVAMNRAPFPGGDTPIVLLGNQALPVAMLPDLLDYLKANQNAIAQPALGGRAGGGSGSPTQGTGLGKDEDPGDLRTGDRADVLPKADESLPPIWPEDD